MASSFTYRIRSSLWVAPLPYKQVVKYGIEDIPEWIIDTVQMNTPNKTYSEKDSAGDTILHYLIYTEKHKAVSFMLEAGANPNDQNKYGDTCLSLIILFWKRGEQFNDVVKLMMRYGANPYIKNNIGVSAYDMASDEVREMFNEIF